MSRFLNNEQEEIVIKAIREAETSSSGEIRVHIEDQCETDDPIERAMEVFSELEMYDTEQRNGVIVYIASEDHEIAIWGDKGIHEKVGQHFWEEEIELITGYFKKGEYAEGLKQAILQIGEKLKEYFPYTKGDVNELSNTISYPEKKEGDADS